MKTTFKQYLLEAVKKMPKAESKEELFNSKVDGRFTLDGSEIHYFGYDEQFDCVFMELKSLVGVPNQIPYDFKCSDNILTSLEGGPQTVGGKFECMGNQIESLKGSPEVIGGSFNCDDNKLKSLVDAPKKVNGFFSCDGNELLSLDGCPQTVGGSFYCKHNHLTSLESIHMHIHEIRGFADFRENPIKSHVLGLLKIKGLRVVYLDNKAVEEIINEYLLGDASRTPSLRDIVDCQEELMDNDLEDYALL